MTLVGCAFTYTLSKIDDKSRNNGPRFILTALSPFMMRKKYLEKILSGVSLGVIRLTASDLVRLCRVVSAFRATLLYHVGHSNHVPLRYTSMDPSRDPHPPLLLRDRYQSPLPNAFLL